MRMSRRKEPSRPRLLSQETPYAKMMALMLPVVIVFGGGCDRREMKRDLTPVRFSTEYGEVELLVRENEALKATEYYLEGDGFIAGVPWERSRELSREKILEFVEISVTLHLKAKDELSD